MSVQHTTAGWSDALTAALTEAAGDTTLVNAARRLIATGSAGPLNVNQGFATTKFPQRDGRVARPRLNVTTLSAQEWDRIEETITARPDAVDVAATSAISDQLADPAHTGGIPLVPAPHDIAHTCTCTPEAATSACAHSVALGLLLADRLRTAPAPLFTLRGRPHQHLKKRLRTKKAGSEPRPATAPTPGPVAAHVASPQPAPPALPTAPIPDPVDLDLTSALPVLNRQLPAPPAPLPDAGALKALAADAAHRAGTLLDGHEAVLCPDIGSDLARFISLPHGAAFRQVAMEHLDLDIVGMGHLQLACTHGGPGGAAAYLERFAVDHDVLAHAQAQIQPLRPAATASIECEDNWLTDAAAGIQLRYGPDARWYPYRAPYGTWQPVPGPSADAAQAYRAARTAGRSNPARPRTQIRFRHSRLTT